MQLAFEAKDGQTRTDEGLHLSRSLEDGRASEHGSHYSKVHLQSLRDHL